MRSPRLFAILVLATAGGMPTVGSAADQASGLVPLGRGIFMTNCAGCHGEQAEGGTLGSLAVPALNGSGHSAHHGLDYLLAQVTNGSIRKGGKMPAFGETLSETERRAAIAYVQSLWPEAIYRDWQQMHSGGHPH